MRPRLVTFDAFDTLFTPHPAVHVQYARVAQSFGVHVDPMTVQESFKSAFKAMSARAPNYGKHLGMRYETWWEELIENLFSMHTRAVPPGLAPALVERFNGRGYRLFSDVEETLRRMDGWRGKVKIGILSNSDPRVPQILETHGIRKHFDIISLSYDSYAKPDRRIFDHTVRVADVSAGECLHVGDNLVKDYHAALHAGWQAVYLDRQGLCTDDSIASIRRLEQVLDIVHAGDGLPVA